MTKDELILRIQDLEDLNLQQEARLQETKTEFKKVSKLLEDINKPKITELQADEIYRVISMAFDNFGIDDCDPQYDFEIDYDGRISVSSCELQSLDMFAEQVHDAVLSVFNVQDDE